MIKQYFRQALNLMRQNRFYTVVYIAGTGLAISLVMVMAIVYHVKTADMAPEVHRSRMLVVAAAASCLKENESRRTTACLSYRTVRECFYALETPECVTAFADRAMMKSNVGNFYASIPGGTDVPHRIVLGCTDANYWRVFRFEFQRGAPYGEADFQSGIRKAVVGATTARRLFGSVEAEGRTMLINNVEYTVCGVVADVPSSMPMAFADVWTPFTTLTSIMELSWAEDVCGALDVCILAAKVSDFDAIRDELARKQTRYNAGLSEYNFRMFGEGKGILSHGRVGDGGVMATDRLPYSYRQSVIKRLDDRSTYAEIILRYLLGALLFLLVPAVNLSGLMSSRMQERAAEIGIRKAFGASRATLFNQAVTENLLLTLLGGLAGLVIACLVVTGMSHTLLLGRNVAVPAGDAVPVGMLLNFHVFFYALCVCVALNLLSSLIPVWRAARKPIVNAIHA
jgi:putative ABC transport system permease protein